MATIALSNTGKGVAVNVPAAAAIQTAMAIKWAQKVDNLKTIGASSDAAVGSMDSDGAGTNPKFIVSWLTDGAGNIRLLMHVPGGGDITGASFPQASLGANGTFIICTIDVVNFSQHFIIYASNGTTVISTATDTFNFGTDVFSITGGANGIFTLNKDTTGSRTQTAQEYAGVEIITTNTVTSAKPAGSDANIAMGWLMQDHGSGTPASTVGLGGGPVLTLTNATGTADTGPWDSPQVATTAVITSPTFSMSVGSQTQLTGVINDATGNPIVNEPVLWSSSNNAVATVNSSGLVTGVNPGTVQITLKDAANQSVTTNATGTITIQQAASGQLTAVPYTSTDNSVPDFTFPVTWRSSDNTKATVSGTGLVAAVAAGTANIIATAGGVDSPPSVVTVS